MRTHDGVYENRWRADCGGYKRIRHGRRDTASLYRSRESGVPCVLPVRDLVWTALSRLRYYQSNGLFYDRKVAAGMAV